MLARVEELVECVPNFSEGRDALVIEAVAETVRRTEGVRVLSVEPDADYNRTVLTFFGSADAVAKGALACARACYERIDMAGHSGGHPRLGSLDVVPFVPVRGMDMQGAVAVAQRVGAAIADDLGVPVYLYARAASRPERTELANIRRGEYEGLPLRLKDPDWAPDFGPAEFVSRFGAAIVGARPFLIAYNVNLTTDDLTLASSIARRVRASGYIEAGLRVPGLLPEVKAIGVLLKQQGMAQVSMNLTDFRVTPIHVAFDAVREEARRLGADVGGSEIVGLAPFAALEAAALHAGASKDQRSKDLMTKAVEYLGLDSLVPFDPARKVLELMLENME